MKNSKKIKRQFNKIYSDLSGYIINSSNNNLPKDVVETYGELTYDGFNQLFNNQSWKGYNFYDLGSGVGKSVMYSQIVSNFDKSYGVEFNKERVQKARTAKNLFIKKHSKTYKTNKKSIRFDRRSMFHKKYFDNNKNSAYFISNLCFTEHMNTRLAHYFNTYRVNKNFKTTIFCSKKIPLKSYKNIKQLNVEMTWSNTSTIYRYDL